jgi:serine-type D-Ala-D-Ala carboxypeptidase/endopeptidase (penicillin-binding protein 4)
MTESWAAENSQVQLRTRAAPAMVAGGEATGSAGRLASAPLTSSSSISQAAGPSVQPGLGATAAQPRGIGAGSAPAVTDVNPFVSAFVDSLADYGFSADTQGFIVETMDGRPLAEHNADQPFNPASVVKVATSLTAISKLGADYRFRTMLYTDGYLEPATSTLHGSLYVMGTGDPVLFPENALLIADQLNRHGIRVVDGNLVVEGKFYYTFSASREASARAFRAAMMPESPNFTQSPAYLQFLSMRAADADRSRFVFGDPASTQQPGNQPPANSAQSRNTDPRPPVTGSQPTAQGAAVQATATATYLPTSGVPYLKITGETLTEPGINTGNLKLLAVHTSLPLIRVLKGQNDFSNNWMATMIGDMVGGPDAVDRFLEDSIGLRGDEIRIVTSSGLGSNYISPRAMAQILRKLMAYLNKQNIGIEELLPVAGIDRGTLEKRFTDAYRGSVVAKTGTLHGVSALAGVAYTRGRGPLIFVIFNHGGSPYSFRGVQDETVKKLITLCGGPAPPHSSAM